MGLAALGAGTLGLLGIGAETAPAWLPAAIGGVEAGALGGGAAGDHAPSGAGGGADLHRLAAPAGLLARPGSLNAIPA